MLGVIARAATLAVVFLIGSSHIAAAADNCTVATKGDSPVAQACAKGGRAEAKKVMKQLVKSAKAKGGKFDCDDCHKAVDNGNFELKAKARDDFKRLLDLAGNGSQTAPSPNK